MITTLIRFFSNDPLVAVLLSLLVLMGIVVACAVFLSWWKEAAADQLGRERARFNAIMELQDRPINYPSKSGPKGWQKTRKSA